MISKLQLAIVSAIVGLSAPAFAQGAASSASPTPTADSATAPSEAGEAAEPASDLGPPGEPPTGKGQIIFFRPGGAGALIGCSVHEGEQVVSKLPMSRYFVQAFEPGAHTFTVASEAKDTLRLEVEEGETYYVRCSIKMGIMIGRPNLSPSTKDEFEKRVAKLKRRAPAA